MAQMSSILVRVAAKRTDWDQIPAYVIEDYEKEIAMLHSMGFRGREFQARATQIYNTIFAPYGYKKPVG